MAAKLPLHRRCQQRKLLQHHQEYQLKPYFFEFVVSDYHLRKRLGAKEKYSLKNMFLVKSIYKTILNQVGDETKDSLTKVQIQDIIQLFNKYSDSTVQVEYE